MTKTIRDLKRGDILLSVPYSGPEKLPITVEYVFSAKRKGCKIIEGTDATGQRVQVPVGHFSNLVEVR